MKKFRIQTVIRNYSRYPIDIVWENAQDLEHVQYLHSNTNREFHLLYTTSETNSSRAYDLMVYRTVRRFHFWGLQSFGFRRIISDFNIHQMEYLPLLGITSTLNSLLYRNQDPEFPTLMVDEVIMEVPYLFRFLKNYFIKALHRHATIQCSEDEPFRKRRSELVQRGIRLPFSIFNQTKWTECTSLFREKLGDSPSQHC